MSISSVITAPVQPPQKNAPVEAVEATKGGKDTKNDSDADDVAAVQKASTPKPTVNFQGQALGRTLNVTA